MTAKKKEWMILTVGKLISRTPFLFYVAW